MKKQTNKSNNREHFKLLIPTLLIASFICFFCIPDFVNMFFQFYHVEEKELLFNILGLSYRIAWLTDTAIYIFTIANYCRKIKFTLGLRHYNEP